MDCKQGKKCPNLKRWNAAAQEMHHLQRVRALLLHDRDQLLALGHDSHITDEELDAWDVAFIPHMGEAT